MLEDLQRHAGKFYGKYSGEVTNNEDKDFFGRIKVKVPSVFGTEVEVRARPCFPYGHFFVPPMGTKVWVEFEAGDTHYPLWVGAWYPQGSTPQKAAISPPDNRVIETASGHTIEIMDKAGEEKITIKHKGNAFINIDKKGSILIANQAGSYFQLDVDGKSATLVDQNGNVIAMNGKGVAITQSQAKTLVQLTDDTVHVAGPNVIIDGTAVSCGTGAAEPTILGQTFMSMWNAFIFHTHPTALGPSGPPVPPALPLSPTMGLTNAVTVK